VAAVLTPVQTKQIRINIHNRNNTKLPVQTTQNTIITDPKYYGQPLAHFPLSSMAIIFICLANSRG
jgi:hypothetical protein